MPAPSIKASKLQFNGWLPEDPEMVNRWLSKKFKSIMNRKKEEPFAEVIRQFQDFIENDVSISTLFEQMFDQIPDKPPYDRDAWGKPLVRDYMTMLRLFNSTLTEAPDYMSQHGYVGLPFTVILSRGMGTPAGKALFQIPSVNEHLRDILNERGKYLSSPASAHVLHSGPGGWFSDQALEEMGGFTEDFIHDPSKPHWGFTSWDDFFTRRFKEGVRPLPPAEDYPGLITSPCEAKVYNIAEKVHEDDLFWIKGIAYSMGHMLANHKFVPQFADGTVYQCFLSALNYHRWHAPVTGTIVDIDVVPGTYFSTSPLSEITPLAILYSQDYFTSVATRVNIYIEANNPQIGLMCFMAVGMTEVSSIEVTVKKGERVIQGQETGMFHFGGSTACLIFRPETKINFTENVVVQDTIRLNAPIGYIEE